ncbi:MAG: hypothetical protein GDA49_11775 [Rhodospirillales bacterium]|nr:hypothetical protein [Rhodospirillales bacterium]
MMCCITYAGESAMFGEPESRFSTAPPGMIMPWIIGLKRTRELLYTGDLITAEEALAMGTVNKAFPDDKLEEETMRYARRATTISLEGLIRPNPNSTSSSRRSVRRRASVLPSAGAKASSRTEPVSTDLPAFDHARPIGIVGDGVIGTRVAWACAWAGLATRLFDVEDSKTQDSQAHAVSWSEGEERAAVEANLMVAPSLAAALCDAQLGFENVPERLPLIQAVHRNMATAPPLRSSRARSRSHSTR